MSSVRCNYCKEVKFPPKRGRLSLSIQLPLRQVLPLLLKTCGCRACLTCRICSIILCGVTHPRWFSCGFPSYMQCILHSLQWFLNLVDRFRASNHRDGNVFLLTKSTPLSSSSSILTADGAALSLSSVGNNPFFLLVPTASRITLLFLPAVYHFFHTLICDNSLFESVLTLHTMHATKTKDITERTTESRGNWSSLRSGLIQSRESIQLNYSIYFFPTLTVRQPLLLNRRSASSSFFSAEDQPLSVSALWLLVLLGQK